MLRFSFVLSVLSSFFFSAHLARALPSYSGTIVGCSNVVTSTQFSPDPLNTSRSFSNPSPAVGSCTGAGAFRADAQSVGVRFGMDSDRSVAQGRADATSIVDDFIVTAQPGLPSIVNAVFRFEVDGSYVASALNLNGSAFSSQAIAGFRARASVASAPTAVLNLQNEVFNQTSFNEAPAPQTWELVTDPVRLFVGQAFSITLNLSGYGVVSVSTNGTSLNALSPGTLGGATNSSLYNTFGLARSGDFVTFEQQGYSLQSQSARIANSAWLPVPEPSSLLLVGFGLALVASSHRERRA